MKSSKVNPYLKVNPVYQTKEPGLFNLVNANVAEAKTLNNYLKFDIESYKDEIIKASALFQEIRYCFINHYINLHKDESIVDLGCGFSPRGVKYAREKRNYLGLDLQSCIDQIGPAVEATLDDEHKPFAVYKACDVSNTMSFGEVVSNIKNPLTLVCEGLVMYFRRYELECFCESIKSALISHGGRFITLDYSVNKLMKACFEKIVGKFQTRKIIKESFKDQLTYSGASKDEMDPSKWFGLDAGSDSFAEQFFLSHGLCIKRIPVYVEGMKVNVLDNLEPSLRREIIDELKEIPGWEVTLESKDSNRIHKNDSLSSMISSKNKFILLESVIGNDLVYNINGHLDSITAVQLLESFEKYSNLPSIKNVDIDCSKMEYISSAGLRVLLMMKKKSNIEKVIIRHPSELVTEILASSGFISIVEIEDWGIIKWAVEKLLKNIAEQFLAISIQNLMAIKLSNPIVDKS